MGFINEYISKENIEKYDIFGIRNKFLSERDKITKDDEKNYKTQWIIDRERDIWFCYAGRVIDQDLDFGQGTGEVIWYLNYKGKNLEVRLQRGRNSGSIKEKPYIKHWIFLSITPESLNDVSNKELRNIIKEALDAYGTNGIASQVEKQNIKFRFENF